MSAMATALRGHVWGYALWPARSSDSTFGLTWIFVDVNDDVNPLLQRKTVVR
jgi:hypothetical protein